MSIKDEIARRRTFAIISHPDAGKTTLTEKLLLYGGAVQLAGSVTARKSERSTTSDWMELERQRGISVNSTVLQFDYRDCCINLLDTPGHKDFSEDTYRVLMAVDAAIMVIDAGKGIETQTRKLFEICRLRGIPIFTFINKLDRPTREPLALMDEIENVLQIHAFAVNWPLGTGPGFQGVFDRQKKQAHFFSRVAGGAARAAVDVHDVNDAEVRDLMDDDSHARLLEELSLLEQAGASFDLAALRSGDLTPVFFGSAKNNFGVQLLLDAFIEHAPPPGPRRVASGPVDVENPAFSGFIFKIQSNMDPRHRDQIAFLRVCSGHFTRDMRVIHAQTGASVRLASSHKLLARERNIVHDAYPGDVIGLVGHPEFGIGDTLTEDPALVYHEIPRFAPECFALLHASSPSQFKRFRAGLDHLLKEGVFQMFRMRDGTQRVPLIGAVGPLQFEVLQYRLKHEFGADSRIEPVAYNTVRWIAPESAAEVTGDWLPSGSCLAEDDREQKVLLFSGQWSHDYFQEKNPKVRLTKLPVVMQTEEKPGGSGQGR